MGLSNCDRVKLSSQYDANSCITYENEWYIVNKLTLDRWALIGASVATLGIDLSSIPAEPNVKFKGNRHVIQVKSQFNCSRSRDGKPDGQGKEAGGNH